LREQGGYTDILILDNGSNAETRRWFETQKVAKVAAAMGLGIHEMWNAGAKWAMSLHPRANLLFLNNDIRIGPDFCHTLRNALRSDDELVAVCPNYDGRTLVEDVAQLHGICANRYDGTGGLAGFAFMVKSELFAAGWEFPEDCKWWFGDNDLTLTIDQMGGWYGMAGGTTVEHLDGGGKTGKWDDPKMQAQLAADQAVFMEKWGAK
jgi:GT2 family glycosyltransferase